MGGSPLFFKKNKNQFFLENMATGGPKAIITHSQRVCRLYKLAIKTAFSLIPHRHDWRYECAIIRARFDETRKEKDVRKLAAMLEAGEEEVWQNQPVTMFKYRNDEDGITYNRQAPIEDYVLDEWHPWEKANYIDYFNKREEFKKDTQAYWEQSLSKKFAGSKNASNEYPIMSPEVLNLK